MIYQLPIIMIICLTVTIVVELFLAFILKVKKKMDFINILLVNILTNPLVVTIPFLINIKFGITERNVTLLIMEVLTVVTEGYIYKKYLNYKKLNPYLLSLILNIGSYSIGVIINNLI